MINIGFELDDLVILSFTFSIVLVTESQRGLELGVQFLNLLFSGATLDRGLGLDLELGPDQFASMFVRLEDALLIHFENLVFFLLQLRHESFDLLFLGLNFGIQLLGFLLVLLFMHTGHMGTGPTRPYWVRIAADFSRVKVTLSVHAWDRAKL